MLEATTYSDFHPQVHKYEVTSNFILNLVFLQWTKLWNYSLEIMIFIVRDIENNSNEHSSTDITLTQGLNGNQFSTLFLFFYTRRKLLRVVELFFRR